MRERKDVGVGGGKGLESERIRRNGYREWKCRGRRGCWVWEVGAGRGEGVRGVGKRRERRCRRDIGSMCTSKQPSIKRVCLARD